MTVIIIIPYILYKVSSGLSVLSISLCTALVFCLIDRVHEYVLYDCVIITRNVECPLKMPCIRGGNVAICTSST